MDYFVIMDPSRICPYTTDETIARYYLEDKYGEHPPKMIQLSKTDFHALQQSKELFFDEIYEQMKGIYCTDTDFECISQAMESDCQELVYYLTRFQKILKRFKGKRAVQLRKAIAAFLKERIPNDDFEIDDDDVVMRLLEKCKPRKYMKG